MNITNPSPFSLQINAKSAEILRDVKANGFRDKPISPLEIDALVHSEISEATEESRKGTPPVYQVGLFGPKGEPLQIVVPGEASWNPYLKPEGRAVEYADALIRILDEAAAQGWDFGNIIEMKLAYNRTRGYRHGGKLF